MEKPNLPQSLIPMSGYWLPIKDGDPRARWLFHRHYSYRPYADGRKPRLIVGPGEKHPYLTPDCLALWAWRRFIDDSGQVGVNNAIFANEGPILSSELIQEATRIAWQIWPGERLYTYVDPKGIKSPNPGYCYKMAGWHYIGKTKNGKHILAIEP